MRTVFLGKEKCVPSGFFVREWIALNKKNQSRLDSFIKTKNRKNAFQYFSEDSIGMLLLYFSKHNQDQFSLWDA